MTQSGEFGVGGQRHLHVIFTFDGVLTPGFIAFLQEKADILSLPLEVQPSPRQVVAKTYGQDALIGAFEMSALIGPECSTVTKCSITVI